MPPHWLNDGIIAFWLEHLRLHILNDDSRVALLAPSITYLICVTPLQELKQFIAPLHLPHKQLILLPLNSAAADPITISKGKGNTLDTAVGVHWSLLVYDGRADSILHFDSAPGLPNTHLADDVKSRIHLILNTTAPLQQIPIPRQSNSYDCGAYVCTFAQRLAHNFLTNKSLHTLHHPHEHLATTVEHTRQDIGKLISRLVDQRDKQNQE